MARPSLYRPEFAEQAEKLCKLGATDVDLADFFDVSVYSIMRWKTRYEEFGKALKVGKGEADDNVERSLYSRATGYTYDSEKIFHYQGEIIRAPIQEHVPPDTTAQIFWLKNRRPEEWRDVQNVNVRRYEQMTDEELDNAIAEQFAELEPRAKDSPTKTH